MHVAFRWLRVPRGGKTRLVSTLVLAAFFLVIFVLWFTIYTGQHQGAQLVAETPSHSNSEINNAWEAEKMNFVLKAKQQRLRMEMEYLPYISPSLPRPTPQTQGQYWKWDHIIDTEEGHENAEPDNNYTLQPDTLTVLSTRYQLEALVGNGSFARVYSAIDLVIRAKVAIKLLPPNTLTRIPRMALNEVVIHRALDGARIYNDAAKHIPSLWDVVYDNSTGSIGLVFPFINGEQLTTALPKLALQPLLLAKYMQQILAALSYVHACRIMHRDISPKNILIGSIEGQSDVQVWLIDFGSSAFYIPNKAYSLAKGTRPYKPPEMVFAEAVGWARMRYHYAIDLWAFGCILACALWRDGATPLFIPSDPSAVSLIREMSLFLGDYEMTKCAQEWYSELPSAAKASVGVGSSGGRGSKQYYLSSERAVREAHRGRLVKLADKLLTCDPQKRPSAIDALEILG